jgi:1,4-dihydroxy-6-naphthoate synthase
MSTVSSPVREISVAHSPDSDDAFMFYGLATNKVRVPGLKFNHTLCDIETLNRQAREGVYDVTAISFHAFPYIQENYALMSCGGSVGDGYGPMLVSSRPFTQDEIKRRKIAVPGKLTTAYLALQLFAPGIETEVVPFRRFSKANTKPASSSTKASLPMTSPDSTASSISADGGRKSPDCRCLSVETPFGARSAAGR